MIDRHSRAIRGLLLAVWCVVASATAGCRACGSSSPEVATPDGGGTAAQAVSDRARPGKTTQNLRSVWGVGDHDVWAVGDGGTIIHFDGKQWAAAKPVTLENLTGVRGTTPADVWACGDKGTIFHWDGSSWTRAAQAEGKTLLSVWTSGPKDVWAVGMDGEGDSGFVYIFDGEKWSGQGVPGSTSIWDVWGSGPNEVWMVGSSPSGTGVVLRGAAKKFDAVGYKGSGVRSAWGVRSGDLWVAPYNGEIVHWDGTAWTNGAAIPGAGSLLRIGGSAPDDVWAVGLEGTALHNRGGGWVKVPTGTTEVLWGVWGRAVDDAWAVGNGGTILRWNGSSWLKG